MACGGAPAPRASKLAPLSVPPLPAPACNERGTIGIDKFPFGKAVVVTNDDRRDLNMAKSFARDMPVRTHPNDVTEEDRTHDLVVISSDPRRIPLQIEGSPVSFTEKGFTIGGHTFDDASNGIAFLQPNPWAPGRSVMFYIGSSWGGLQTLASKELPAKQFMIVGGEFGLLDDGDFCTDEPMHWTYWAPFVEDRHTRAQQLADRAHRTETAHNVLLFQPGSDADDHHAFLARRVEDDYALILATLKVNPLPEKITTYYWPSREEKARFTGNVGNGVAFPAQNIVHIVYGNGINAGGAHEYVHVIAARSFGPAGSAGLSEGLAVMFERWHGRPLAQIASEQKRAGTLPSAKKLIEDLRSLPDEISYPAAGHLVGFIIGRIGIDKFKTLFRAREPAVRRVLLDMTIDELDQAWRASIE